MPRSWSGRSPRYTLVSMATRRILTQRLDQGGCSGSSPRYPWWTTEASASWTTPLSVGFLSPNSFYLISSRKQSGYPACRAAPSQGGRLHLHLQLLLLPEQLCSAGDDHGEAVHGPVGLGCLGRHPEDGLRHHGRRGHLRHHVCCHWTTVKKVSQGDK